MGRTASSLDLGAGGHSTLVIPVNAALAQGRRGRTKASASTLDSAAAGRIALLLTHQQSHGMPHRSEPPIEPSGALDASFRWSAADLADARRYTHAWSAAELQALQQAALQGPEPGDALECDSAPRTDGVLDATLARVRGELRDGLGVVLLRGLPFGAWTLAQARRAVWAIARAIGVPVSQTAKGARLVDVMDTSAVEATPRQFKTRQELRLHTDPASDLMGLACVRPAARGGDSVLTSAISVHDALRRERPDLLAELYRGFAWHRFGEGRPDDAPVSEALVPVFARCEGRISCRYVRSAIVAGHRDRGDPLSARQLEALDALDRLAASPDLRVSFRMTAGDLLLVNNLTILHARTEFVDALAPAPPRHLLRLWLAGLDGFRPLPPVLNYFNRGQCGIAVTGQEARYDMAALRADPASGGTARLGVAPSQRA
jgi:hypothetical protein